jgi:hypothetical protein
METKIIKIIYLFLISMIILNILNIAASFIIIEFFKQIGRCQ